MTKQTNQTGDPTEIQRMSITEFREFGYLQEVNRRFFHPLGLALEVLVDDVTGVETLGGIWDYRDDPEGIRYLTEEIDVEKYDRVMGAMLDRRNDRIALTGEWVQVVNDQTDQSD